ncbi:MULTISPECIES: serine/threonine-protein kinase [Kitasatospora]|uniref:Putative serine/threonine protein kinase n=1 Tax=Kitasatospora setae (strain ATCC 33774 / DSM 43861 / JCM 3304 / KCC A-0304 / NBRC 14216 / KM-6054) TaxID=452652 RepID=E4N523_KITSK|nr:MULTISPECIES: serine/threonine-protein kinase [Kitasatospora]BAJ26304.1 putative serine/threonine protein kinase [Kitasatospora setae KM-6054]
MTTHGGTGGSGFDLAGSGAEPLAAEDPRAIGPVPLLGRLGAGGMGRVYLGVVGDRYAAVKQVLPQFVEDPDYRRHFGHELDNLARLPEEATAPLLAADREARPPWLATAYVPGLTLDRVLAVHGGPLDTARVWLLLRETAASLRAVHALDMIHRDLKPSNVMLTARGATLIDFGIARAADQSRLTRTGMVLGTPAYMAPEQANGDREFTSAVDVFALGALLAYAATGRPPFGEGSGVDMLYRVIHTEPDLDALRELSPVLAETVAACLDKNPAGRPSADRLVRLAAQHGPAPAERAGWPEPVLGTLLARSAFAEQPAPAADPAADGAAEPLPPDGAPTKVLRVTGPPPEPGRRWHRRLVPFVVPVLLVAGGTAAVQLLPFGGPPQQSQGQGQGQGQGQDASSPGLAGTPGGTPGGGAASGPTPAADPDRSPNQDQGPTPSTPPTDSPAQSSADPDRKSTPSAPKSTAPAAKPTTPPANPANPVNPATPAKSSAPARAYGPRCVFTTAASCTSDDPTVELTSSGGWTDCTFTFTTDWGDGNTTYTDTNGTGSADVRKTYATHRYAAPGTYRINVRAVTDSGFCLATGASLTFTLTP